MRHASHRQAFLEWAGLSKIGVIAGGVLVSAVLVQGVLLATGRQFGMDVPSRPEIVARLLVTLTMIVSWCAFYYGYQLVCDHNSTAMRALQAEAEALRNELKHLQSQISPHFLMNALNTIQGVRFGDGLETRIDCDFDVRGVRLPPVAVQRLVENAIKYGGQTGPQPIRVHVTARGEDGWVRVLIRIPAEPAPSATPSGFSRAAPPTSCFSTSTCPAASASTSCRACRAGTTRLKELVQR